MEILVAKSAGFCFGVEKAIESVYKEIETGKKPIYTFGPIIHNEQVVGDLEEKGVSVIDTIEELENLQSGSVVIRSHGVPKKIYDAIEKQNLEIVDATCPFVKKIHNIVKKESEKGKRIVIIGNDNHPEVEGIKGWVVGEAIVVKDEEDIEKIDSFRNESICIVSQTTFNYNKFKYLVEIITKVDAMIVIGGKNSSNTQKLYDICKNECKDTYYIQTVSNLNLKNVDSLRSIGITAGASTPKKIIEEVVLNVRDEF